MCSKSPFLLDLCVRVLAQFGQRGDLLKIDMAHISPSGRDRHSTSKLAIAKATRVGIAERRNVTARERARIAVRSPVPFLRQIVNPHGDLQLATALFYSTFAPYALASCLDQRAWILQHSKGNRPYTEEGRV
jgi:hypothetical protein